MSSTPPPPPPPPPPPSASSVPPPSASAHLRADGSVKGVSFRVAVGILVAGIVMVLAAGASLVTAFLDTISGPVFDVPGSREVDLEEGSWVLYERTDGSGWVTIGARDVRVEGPATVEVRDRRTNFTETVTRNDATYTGAVRLEVPTAGTYTVTVGGGEPSQTPSGEVLLARPLGDLFGRWPWFVVGAAGAVAAVVGLVLWLVGASHRRAVRSISR